MVNCSVYERIHRSENNFYLTFWILFLNFTCSVAFLNKRRKASSRIAVTYIYLLLDITLKNLAANYVSFDWQLLTRRFPASQSKRLIVDQSIMTTNQA